MKSHQLILAGAITAISWSPAHSCDPIMVDQLFVSKALSATGNQENGKGNMVEVDASGKPVRPEDIEATTFDIVGCTASRVALRFKAARYAQSAMDTTTVAVKIYNGERLVGRMSSTIPSDLMVTNYSEVTGRLQEFSKNTALSGTATSLKLVVIPGDWGVELRDLVVEFKK